MIVTVVAYAPVYLADGQELASTGGFDWYPEEADARAAMVEWMQKLPAPLGHAWVITPVDVPDPEAEAGSQEARDEITEWLLGHSELYEVSTHAVA